ncbi:hypothetical protein PAERUG_P48_London_17_VIM_2_01_13_05595 [Pseudomonas aeruginosa]|nr:hypothetical protein PAERUG_P48_London_17_VIM_2_01_13_05595 [Pseudomonas aeruginosa]
MDLSAQGRLAAQRDAFGYRPARRGWGDQRLPGHRRRCHRMAQRRARDGRGARPVANGRRRGAPGHLALEPGRRQPAVERAHVRAVWPAAGVARRRPGLRALAQPPASGRPRAHRGQPARGGGGARQLRCDLPRGAARRRHPLHPGRRAGRARRRRQPAAGHRDQYRYHQRPATAGAPARGQGAGGRRQRGEVVVPGEHEPRDPHADECRAGHAATGPADRSQRTPARLPGQGQLGGNLVARPAQRHPRLLEDRGRQTGPGNAPLRAGAADAGPGRGALRQPGRQGRRGDLRHRSRAAQRGGRRPPAPAADPHQPGRQRTEVHRPRARPGELAASGARRPPGAPAGAGGGHRHRHQRGTAAAHLRRFHPGRGVHLATLRRHRPRPVHMQTPGRPDGR